MIVVIGVAVAARLMVCNELMAGADTASSDFWKLWYMKIYYPTHTRLDGLGTGVLTGYLMQHLRFPTKLFYLCFLENEKAQNIIVK
ncbi:hypothetical protein [Chryseobacterium aureum]|uniref:hypothetical protein n=1 Tax=Chryseobacterium aureum TaxID=2497456 RepID=UPI000F85B8B0|nr:hypothetical protein [Chryseobacterium aureum]